MAWVRLEDTFCEHPKIEPLEDGPFRLHVKAICYANRNLTDGFVPAIAARAMGGPRHKSACRALIEAGLWELARGGYRIHDYLEFQPSRSAIAEIRETQRAGGKKRADSASRKGGRFAPAEDQQGPGGSAGGNHTSSSPAQPVPVPKSLLKEETGTTNFDIDAILRATKPGRLA